VRRLIEKLDAVGRRQVEVLSSSGRYARPDARDGRPIFRWAGERKGERFGRVFDDEAAKLIDMGGVAVH